jgi:hypothetical protein
LSGRLPLVAAMSDTDSEVSRSEKWLATVSLCVCLCVCVCVHEPSPAIDQQIFCFACFLYRSLGVDGRGLYVATNFCKYPHVDSGLAYLYSIGVVGRKRIYLYCLDPPGSS